MKTKRQEQFGTGFRSVHRLHSWVTAKVLMLLVMLMVSVQGAWAQDSPFSSQCYGTAGASKAEGPASLLDNDEDTKWCVVRDQSQDPEIPSIIFRVKTNVKLSQYEFKTANDTEDYPERNPKNWTLEAKYSRADEWVVISSVENASLPSDGFMVSESFSVNAEYQNKSFRYFRLTFGQTSGFQLADIFFSGVFAETDADDDDLSLPDPTICGDDINNPTRFAYEEATINPSSDEGNPIGNLFDEDPETSWTRESSTEPVDIYFHTRTAVKPKSYYWTLAEEHKGYIDNWTLYAKVNEDDATWTQLDYHDISNDECTSYQSKTYSINSNYQNTQFKYFKLHIQSAFSLNLSEFVINGDYSDPTADSDDFNDNGVIYAVRPSKGYATVIGYTGNATDVVIPATLDYFGVPCSVDSIRHHAFQENRTITSISIPKSLKCIGASAFDNCSALKDVIFTGTDNLLNTIEEYAFKLSGVTNFDFTALPNLESIGVGAFESAKVQTVDFSQSTKLTNLGEFIFADCNVQGSVDLSAFATLPKGLFAGCSKLTSFTLHPDVESIPDYIFRGTGVTTVDLSAYPKISSVGIFAFSECQNLTSIVLPNNMEVLQRQSLSACGKLTTVTLPANLKTIESAAFAGCSSLASLTFPASLELISAQAFQGTAFTEIDFSSAPDATLLNGVFGGCAQLARVVMPTNNTEVGNELFKGCTSLTEVVLPVNATRIGQRAFEDCTGLTAISLPSSVSQIDEGAFHNCSNLQTFTMPASLVTIGNYAFEGCTKLPDFTLPATLTSIGSSAFKGCTSITSVTIPDEVTVIKANTFSGCSKLTNLNLGTSKMKLRTLESDAFTGCPLTNIMVYSTLDNWDNQTTTTPFSASAYENATVTFGACPKGDVRNLKVWKDFKHIVGMIKNYHTYVCPGLTDCEVHFYALPTYSYNIKEDFGIHNINGAVLVSGSATGDIVLPDEVEGFPIVGIAKNIFNENSNVTSISFPGTLRMIENNAVEKMSNLTKVEFRDQKFPRGENCYIGYAVYSVEDEEAFYECDALEEVVIGCNLDWYDGEDEPFEDRDNLKTIRITPGCHEFGKDSGSNTYLFNYCEGIKNLIIEDSEEMLYFRKYSFQDRGIKWNFCIEPDYLYLGRTVDENCMKDYDYSPFYNWHINKLVVGDYVQYISKWLFYNVKEIGIEQLGKNIKYIGYEAFGDNSTGVRITLSPDCYCPNLERIEEGAFYGADLYDAVFYSFWFDPNNPSESKLKRVETEGLYFGTVLYDRIYLPATIEYLGRRAFNNRDNNIRSIYFYPNLHEKTVEISSEVYSDIDKYGGKPLEIVCHSVCANSDMGMCGFPERRTLDDFNRPTVRQTTFEYDLHVTESKKGSTLQSDGLYHEVCNACGTDDGRSEKTGNYYIHNWNGSNDLKIHKDGSSYSYAGPLAIDDSKPFQSPVSFSAESVSYNRNNIKNQWGTIVVPFDVTGSNDYDFYTLTSATNEELTLTKVNGTLNAGTPALIRINTELVTDQTYNLELNSAEGTVTVNADVENGSSANGLTLTGSYGVKEITSENGYIISNNKFWSIQDVKGDNNVYCAPFRAYIASSAPALAKALSISISEEADAIEAITAITEGDAEYYDMNGRRINSLQTGVNIVKYSNGKTKKVIVK